MSHIRRDINLPNGRGNFFKPGGTGFKSRQQSSTCRRSSALHEPAEQQSDTPVLLLSFIGLVATMHGPT